MSSSLQPASIDGVAHALSDGTRRALLRLVRDEERSAGDLAEQFNAMSRPAVSQHLRVLHDAGLVTVRSEGSRRMYRARPEGLAEMWRYLDEMWTDRLARLKVAAERAEWPQRQRKPAVDRYNAEDRIEPVGTPVRRGSAAKPPTRSPQ